MKATFNIQSRLVVAFVFAFVCSVRTYGVVVDFDDLDYSVGLTGSDYAGLTWETGNAGDWGNFGVWRVAGSDASVPQSPPHAATNFHGATLMGIGFPNPVDVLGAYFAGGGDPSPDMWADGVRVHGYLGDTEVAVTDWFMDIDDHPDWFAMNLENVDRIVIEADPGVILMGYPVGYYGMDDLTYVPEPSTLLLCAVGGLALLRRRRG